MSFHVTICSAKRKTETLANEAVIHAIEQVARAKTEAVNKQTKTLVNAEIAKIGQTFGEFTAANPGLTGGRTFQLSGNAEQQLIAQLRMNVNEALKTTMHPEGQLEQIVQTALRESDGNVGVLTVPREGEGVLYQYSTRYACPEHGVSFGELEPRR